MYWGWQRLPKGTKPKKVGVYIPVLLLPMPCQTRSPFFPLRPVGVGCSSCISPPTLPDHRAPGEQGHWGANIWVRLKHPLLKDLPCLLWRWPRPRDSVSSVVLFLLFYFCYFISVIFSLGAANTPHPDKAGGSLCFSALIRDVYSILALAHAHYRASLPKRLHSQNMGWSNTECTMHLTPIFNYIPLNYNSFSSNFLTELKIPTKGRSPLMPLLYISETRCKYYFTTNKFYRFLLICKMIKTSEKF